ncbi:MAG: hypothetical protein IPO81_00070 [Kouleothrix sp.]|nr:hypothetical protein [Kouleothrix sp.]
MPSQDDIRHQQSLLDIHRATLAHSLRQAAAYGGVDFAPPVTATTIRSARADIQRVKGILRDWGVAVDDLPDDVEAPATTLTPPRLAPAGSPTFVFNAPVNASAASFGGTQAIDRMEVTMGDNINISNVSGSILNIKATLDNVTQTIGGMPGDEAAKNELKQLMAELATALQQAPADKAQDAEAVAKRAEVAIAEAAKPKPDKEDVAYSLSRLKKAAENLGQVLPIVVTIAGKIATQIMGLIP